jgi:hypothetical protein
MSKEAAVIITGIMMGAMIFSNIIGKGIKKYLRYALLAFMTFILLTRWADILNLMDSVAVITWPAFKAWIINGSKKLVELINLIAH